MKDKKETCSNCKHWRNQQSELDYSKHCGICTCFKWKFSVTGEGDCMVLDRQNKSEKHMGVQRFETQYATVPHGAPDYSRYCFVTEEAFSCIHFKKLDL